MMADSRVTSASGRNVWHGAALTEVTATLSTFIEGEAAKESKVTKKAIGYCGMAGPPE